MTVKELKLKLDNLDDKLDVRIATDVYKHFLSCNIELKKYLNKDVNFVLIY